MARGSVKKRGDVYRSRFYDNDGRERQKSFRTKAQATAWLNDQLSQLSRGEWVNPAAGAITFRDYASQWLAHQHVRKNTRALHEGRIRLYLDPVVGGVQLRSVRRSHVVEVIARMAERGLSPLVIRYTMTTLKAVLGAAVADRLIPTNVAADRSIAVPKREHERMVMLSTEQVAAIAQRIEPRYRTMVVVAAATGLRSGELRALTLDRISPPIHLAGDVTPRQVTLTIDRQLGPGGRFDPVKTASSLREVTVGASVVAELVAAVRAFGVGRDGLIFATPDGDPVLAGRASRLWVGAVSGLDLPSGATWHSLRHLHASELLAAGLNPAAVAKRLGHANASITLSIYSHALQDDEERMITAAEAIAARLA